MGWLGKKEKQVGRQSGYRSSSTVCFFHSKFQFQLNSVLLQLNKQHRGTPQATQGVCLLGGEPHRRHTVCPTLVSKCRLPLWKVCVLKECMVISSNHQRSTLGIWVMEVPLEGSAGRAIEPMFTDGRRDPQGSRGNLLGIQLWIWILTFGALKYSPAILDKEICTCIYIYIHTHTHTNIHVCIYILFPTPI